MRPSGAHTHGSDPVEVIGALLVLAAIGAAVEFVLSIIWVIAVIVGVAVVAGIVLLVWMARRGSAFAVVSRAALPPSQATPLPSRAAQALPAPQIQINNIYVTPEQVRAITDRRDQ